MSNISVEELSKFSAKQLRVLRKAKNNLDTIAYPFVTAKEMKIVDRVLTKIKTNKKEEQDAKTNEEKKEK